MRNKTHFPFITHTLSCDGGGGGTEDNSSGGGGCDEEDGRWRKTGRRTGSYAPP